MRNPSSLLGVAAAALTVACAAGDKSTAGASVTADSARADSIARARQDSINRTLPGYIVDSIFPVEEELRRFRAAIGGPSATALIGGSQSLDALVRRFVTALETRDTSSLRAMVVHVREFADLYYMDSPYSHPPYKQSPALAWTMIQNPSLDGLKHLLDRFGGKPMQYSGHTCNPKVEQEGRTTRYAECEVTTRDAAGATVTRRLFGSIIARDGQFKFLSYANRL